MELIDQVKNYASISGISLTKLAEEVEMSRPGLSAALKNNTLKISTLEKIASVLSIPTYVFFEGQKEKDRQLSNFKTLERIAMRGGVFNMETYIEQMIPENFEILKTIELVYETVPVVNRAKLKKKHQKMYPYHNDPFEDKNRMEYNNMMFAIEYSVESQKILKKSINKIIDLLVKDIVENADIKFLMRYGFATPTTIGLDAHAVIAMKFHFETDIYEKVEKAFDSLSI